MFSAAQASGLKTPRFWALELDNKKSGSDRLALTGISQTGEVALFATQPGWLMTRRAGYCSLDNKKSGSARLKERKLKARLPVATLT